LSGGQGVAGSNPVVPTNWIKELQNHQIIKVLIIGFRDNIRDNNSHRLPKMPDQNQAATLAEFKA